MLQHSWSAVMASALRTSLSSIQSKLSQGDRHSTDRKAPCGNPSHNLLASRCTTAFPLSVLITPIFLIFPAANATCIDWWFCRMLFFFFKCQALLLSLWKQLRKLAARMEAQCLFIFFRVWTILPPKRHVWRTVVSKMEIILADHFSFDKSQIAAHDSLFTGTEVEQHIQNSPRCRR